MSEPLSSAQARIPSSHTSRILTTVTWHKRVQTCLNHVHDVYVLCYSTYTSYTWLRHVYTFLEMIDIMMYMHF